MKRIPLLALIASLLLPGAVAAQYAIETPPPAVAPTPIMRTPVCLQNPAPDAMTVMWLTNVPCLSWVEYGTDTLDMHRAATWEEGIMMANNKINKIELTGLNPGTRYYYRACSREIKHYGPYEKTFGETARTPLREFTTWDAGATDFTVAVFNDLHNRPTLLSGLMERLSGVKYDLAIFNGDCFSDVDTESDIVDVLAAYCTLYGSDTVPSLFMRGNHETRGACSPLLWNYISKAGEHSYTAFSLGDTRFVLLDCGEDKPDDHPEYSGMNDFTAYREAQACFLARETASAAFTAAARRILVHHIPIYPHREGSFNPCHELWQPYLAAAPFDVSLHGHTHSFRHIPRGEAGNNFPVVIGGGNNDKSATVMLLRKSGSALNLRVIRIDGQTLLDLDL